MRGARNFLAALWLCAALTTIVGSAAADEFGNILVPSVENASRQASAQALGAAGLILKGFQSRELRDRGNEKEAFSAAAHGLRSAAEAMDGVINQGKSGGDIGRVLDAPFKIEKDIPERDRPAFLFWISQVGGNVETIKTRGDVFAIFSANTKRLANVVESVTGNYDRGVFRGVTDDLGLYLRMGSVVSAIMRAAS
jgi:hypothetical protein